MALRDVVAMTPGERAARRTTYRQAHQIVESLIANGVTRSRSFGQAASAIGCERNEVVRRYWHHVHGWV